MNLFRLKKAIPTNQKFNERALLLVALVLACFALPPMVQAVSPAPDGGYPNGNTAEGNFALQFLTTGTFNTALGNGALFSDTAGSQNTAVGAGALFNNIGTDNTANGAGALFNNTGSRNTAIGLGALFSNTTASENTAVGWEALAINTGVENTAVGSGALRNNIDAFDNTAVGWQALFNNTTITGVSGNGNTAIGSVALFNNTTGAANTAVGSKALNESTTGDGNTAIGQGALIQTDGFENIAVGHAAGSNLTSGFFNIYIGTLGGTAESNTTRIGTASSQTRTFVSGIFNVTTATAAIPVVVSTQGQLGTVSSSRRFKKEIKAMDKTSEAIHALKPVTFHYKSDTQGMPQFGLIAEEVAAVNPDLVVRDEKGEIYSVRYDAVNAMLLNEFLKEHRKNEEQEATIARQQKQIEALTAGLQKVSAEIEISRPAPRVVDSH